MVSLLFKLFPTLWPFIKEFLLGGKDHPHNFGREENKRPGLMSALLFIITALLYALNITMEEKDKLSLELKAALKPSTKVEEVTLDLYVCTRAKHALETEAADLTKTIKVLEKDLSICRTPPPKSDLVEPIKLKPKPLSTMSQETRRRLEELSKGD